ncbi:MAG: hypothetical protein NVS4B10_02450 [Myxococcales bacterium]
MSSLKIGRSHRARKALFTRGIRRGYLVLEEIDEALPSGSLTDAERWLLFYSLRAARVEVRDRQGNRVDLRSHAGERPRGLSQVEANVDAELEAEAAEEAEEGGSGGDTDGDLGEMGDDRR